MRETLGGQAVAVRPVIAGTRSSWHVDVTRGDEVVSVIVRRTRDTLQVYGDAARETRIYRALRPTSVPVPEIYAIDADRGLVAAQRVVGTDDLSGLDFATREAQHHLPIPDGLDMRDAQLPGGLFVRRREPNRSFAFGISNDEIDADLQFDAVAPALINAPKPCPPFAGAYHVDQAGRVTGRITLRSSRCRWTAS